MGDSATKIEEPRQHGSYSSILILLVASSVIVMDSGDYRVTSRHLWRGVSIFGVEHLVNVVYNVDHSRHATRSA